MKTRTLYLMTALLLSVAAIEPSSAGPQGTLSAALEQGSAVRLPSHRTIGRRAGFRCNWQTKRNRLNEGPGACAALAKSLDYYRMALAKETGTPLAIRQRPGDDEGIGKSAPSSVAGRPLPNRPTGPNDQFLRR